MATPSKDSLKNITLSDFKFDKYDIYTKSDVIHDAVKASMRQLQKSIPEDRIAIGPVTTNMEHDVATDTYKVTYTTQTIPKDSLPKPSLKDLASKVSMWQIQWAQNVLRQPSGFFANLYMQQPAPRREPPRDRNTLEEIERILEVCDAVMQASQGSLSESQP